MPLNSVTQILDLCIIMQEHQGYDSTCNKGWWLVFVPQDIGIRFMNSNLLILY